MKYSQYEPEDHWDRVFEKAEKEENEARLAKEEKKIKEITETDKEAAARLWEEYEKSIKGEE